MWSFDNDYALNQIRILISVFSVLERSENLKLIWEMVKKCFIGANYVMI